MDLQVAVFDVERQVKPLTLDGAGERRSDVEVQGVAEFVGLRRAAGFDAGRGVAGIVPSEARFAERPQQIAQGAESQEVESLVGNFEARLGLGLADLAAYRGTARRVVWLIDADVVFLLHAIDELFDKLLELLGTHRLDLLPQLLVQHVAVHQRFSDSVAQIVERLLVQRPDRSSPCTAAEIRFAADGRRERQAGPPCSSPLRDRERISCI